MVDGEGATMDAGAVVTVAAVAVVVSKRRQMVVPLLLCLRRRPQLEDLELLALPCQGGQCTWKTLLR